MILDRINSNTMDPGLSILPDDDLKNQTYIPDNFNLSDNFTLGQLSSRAIVTKNKLRPQVGLSYGEIAYNLSDDCFISYLREICKKNIKIDNSMQNYKGYTDNIIGHKILDRFSSYKL